jgi:hypothetical protein
MAWNSIAYRNSLQTLDGNNTLFGLIQDLQNHPKCPDHNLHTTYRTPCAMVVLHIHCGFFHWAPEIAIMSVLIGSSSNNYKSSNLDILSHCQMAKGHILDPN